MAKSALRMTRGSDLNGAAKAAPSGNPLERLFPLADHCDTAA